MKARGQDTSMAIERETIVKRAERLLQQGRLDGAIEEYARLVDAQPRDWNARNALGDLYARRGDTARATAEFLKVAQHLEREGFLPRAAALYKKVLKVEPACEQAIDALGSVAAGQGLLADAKVYFRRLAALRRDRHDSRGVEDCVLRLAEIDPTDPGSVRAAVPIAVRRGEPSRACGWLTALGEALEAAGRGGEALEARVEAARLTPDDATLHAQVVEACVAAGDLDRAAPLLDLGLCGDAPDLLLRFAKRELDALADPAPAVAALTRALALDPERLDAVAAMAAEVVATAGVDQGFRCLEAAVDAAILDGRVEQAVEFLDRFVAATSHSVAAARLEEARREAGLAPRPAPVAGAGPQDEAPEPADDAGGADEGDEVPVDLSAPAALEAGGLVINAEDVDLSVVLAGLDRDQAAPPQDAAEAARSLTSVFADLRERAGRDAAEGGDGASAYEQGVAAIEAGQVAAGVDALRAAARDPRLRFAAASRLGWVFVAEGDHDAAIEWFERAAEAPAREAADSHAVLYALAQALDRRGEPARALAVLLELDADAGGYRDVRIRISELRERIAGEPSR